VTFLFTDVEGSTLLLDELGEEAYARALAEHRRAVREAFAAHGGVEVDTQGDAFFVAFGTAPAALEAAAAVTAGLAFGPVQVRVGVHTGTPLVTDEGYVGVDVHRAARIAAAGHGGQVLVSAATAALAAESALRNLGEHRFKDLRAAERVFQLGAEEFPPLNSLYRSNLPVPPTAFLGRDREVAEVADLLTQAGARLLTLTGPGGTGKTRLAMQAAAEASESFPDGVWWVPLAPVRDSQLALFSVAQTLGVKEQPGSELADTLAAELAGKRSLLLLDNLEHLLPDAAAAVGILRDSDGPVLLVTSRERLRIQGEQSYPVQPLVERDGVELFSVRARALDPAFSPTPAIRELCARLDQLPLPIELAAARTELFSAEQLLERVSQRLDLLKGGRDADPRQQTLRATIDWSYDLLTEDEAFLFARLSVFAGGCTLEAAEEVAGADADTLQSLLDKSLLRRDTDKDRRPRYWMLETIREYAAERLERSFQDASIFRRHAEYMLALAESANLDVEAEGQQRHDLVMRERENVHGALGWALRADPELGLRLAVALEDYWFTNEPLSGVRWFQALLAEAPAVPPKLTARALCAFGGSAHMAGDYQRAELLYEESLTRFRVLGEELGAALAVFRLGSVATTRGDLKRGRALLEESLDTFRQGGSRKGEMQALGYLGELTYREGDPKTGFELLKRSAAMAEALGAPSWRGAMLGYLVQHALDNRHLDEADSWARERLELSYRTGDLTDMLYTLADLALIAAEAGDPLRAGRLWGTLEVVEGQGPVGGWATDREQYAVQVLATSTQEVTRGQGEGRRMPLDDAVKYALRFADEPDVAEGATPSRSPAPLA
jgi:predicted ATPase